MKKIYYVADRELGNYANHVEYFSSKKRLNAYIEAEMAKGNKIVYYYDDAYESEHLKYYWDWEYVN